MSLSQTPYCKLSLHNRINAKSGIKESIELLANVFRVYDVMVGTHLHRHLKEFNHRPALKSAIHRYHLQLNRDQKTKRFRAYV